MKVIYSITQGCTGYWIDSGRAHTDGVHKQEFNNDQVNGRHESQQHELDGVRQLEEGCASNHRKDPRIDQ